MNEDQVNVNNTNTQNTPDAVTNNPMAFQKITSKKLEIVQNASPEKKEKEKLKLPKKVKLIVAIVIITAIIIVFYEIIYPTYFKKTYTVEYACSHPYNCVSNGNGTSTCSFFDDNNKLVYVTCKSDIVEEKEEQDDTSKVDITIEEANKIVNKARKALNYSSNLSVIFDNGFTNNESLLNDKRVKLLFLVYYLNDNSNVIDDIETGLKKIDYTLLKEEYKKMYNDDFDSAILKENEMVKDGSIFLSIEESTINNRYLFKTKDIVQDSNTYTISVVVLDYESEFTTDDEVFSKIEYDESKAKYNLTIIVEKDNDSYIVKDIK